MCVHLHPLFQKSNLPTILPDIYMTYGLEHIVNYMGQSAAGWTIGEKWTGPYYYY